MDILHSGRREVRGPRPPSLKVNKESHKIRRKPVPVIIYTVSPKKIHATPNEFMSLVQRLTGADTSPDRPPAAPFQQKGISTSTSSATTTNGSNSRTSSGSSLCGAMEGSIGWKMDPHMIAMMEAMGGGHHHDHDHHQSSFVQPTSQNPNIDHLFIPFPNQSDFDPSPVLDNHGSVNYTNIDKDGNSNDSLMMVMTTTMAATTNPSINNLVVNMPCPKTSDIFSTLFDL